MSSSFWGPLSPCQWVFWVDLTVCWVISLAMIYYSLITHTISDHATFKCIPMPWRHELGGHSPLWTISHHHILIFLMMFSASRVEISFHHIFSNLYLFIIFFSFSFISYELKPPSFAIFFNCGSSESLLRAACLFHTLVATVATAWRWCRVGIPWKLLVYGL